MSRKEEIIKLLEDAQLADIEMIREDEGLTLVRFYYEFDQEELDAAQNFADSEDEDEGFDEIPAEEQDEDTAPAIEINEELAELEEDALDEVDLAYEEEEEYFGDAKQKYLSEIAIDHVGEILEDIQDELGMEVQYVGYDLDEEEYEAFEFVALIFEKGRELNIEEILDELDI